MRTPRSSVIFSCFILRIFYIHFIFYTIHSSQITGLTSQILSWKLQLIKFKS